MLADRKQHGKQRVTRVTRFVVEISGDWLTFALPGFNLIIFALVTFAVPSQTLTAFLSVRGWWPGGLEDSDTDCLSLGKADNASRKQQWLHFDTYMSFWRMRTLEYMHHDTNAHNRIFNITQAIMCTQIQMHCAHKFFEGSRFCVTYTLKIWAIATVQCIRRHFVLPKYDCLQKRQAFLLKTNFPYGNWRWNYVSSRLHLWQSRSWPCNIGCIIRLNRKRKSLTVCSYSYTVF